MNHDLAVAFYLSRPGIKISKFKPKLIMLAVISLPGLLILLQPDAGSTLVYLAFIFVLYREGMSGNIMIVGIVMVLLFILTLFAQQTWVTVPFIDYQLGGEYVLLLVLLAISILIFVILRGVLKKAAVILIVGYVIMVTTVRSTRAPL